MNLDEIDFNQLYVEQKEKTSFKMKSKESWDQKAQSMNTRVHNSIYNHEFLNLIKYDKDDTLLDVGCGVGNLSLKLATKLKKVYSLDYSSKMLEILNENAKNQKIKNIETLNMSWYDDWNTIENVDIVVASRSMEVKNMSDALHKLNNKANKRVYLSYKVGGSFLKQEILDVLQKKVVKKPDYIYIVNILYQIGINASVNFIRSEGKRSIYSTYEEFKKSVEWSIGELDTDEEKRLEEYYKNHVENEIENNDYVHWAVISWAK